MHAELTPRPNPDTEPKKDISPLPEKTLGAKIGAGSHADIYEISKPKENFPYGIVKR